jgi:FKBP-type peptidyl-prolyl cis-trans isomerase
MVALLASFAAAQDTKPASRPASSPAPEASDAPVQTLSSGLKYQVLRAGEASKPARRGDYMKAHYEGRFADGEVFESTYKNGEPARFRFGGVPFIPGMSEALSLMSKGAKWRVTIPPELGYGKAGTPNGKIPPDATLTFDLEIVDIKSGDPLPEPPKEFVPVDAAKAKTTESKILCQTLAEGGGEAAKEGDTLVVHFNLWGPDQKLLQSTKATGEPMRIPVAQLKQNTSLPFMREMLAQMKPGEKRLLSVPPEQAFGAQARGPLPAGSTTTWELEIEKVLRPMTPPEFVKPADLKLTKSASGLETETIREGTGETPAPTDKVIINYVGWFTDGRVFDSSFQRGEPSNYALKQLVPGWQEALGKMKEGAIVRLVIPPSLAYGARGYPGLIPPDTTLVFYIELVRVPW